MAEKKLNSKNFIMDLLIVEILEETNYENPKTVEQILKNLKERWRNIFPNDTAENIGALTVRRHIADLKISGLLDIRIKKNKRTSENSKGRKQQYSYYNATRSADGKIFIFTPEEFKIIAMPLYRTSSLSKEETKKILFKLKKLVNISDESFNKIFKTQSCKELTRKTTRDTLPILQKIFDAITGGKKIKFKLYDPVSFKTPNLPPKFQKKEVRDKVYKVSPYFTTWNNDESYLVFYDPKNDDKDDFENRRWLSHFQISQMASIEILDEDAVPLEEISDFARYAISKDKIFSTEKYLMEHINMTPDVVEMLKITIYFKKNFLFDFINQFGSAQNYQPIPNISAKEEMDYQAVVNLPDSKGTYQWFMQHADSVKIIGPREVREKLKSRFQKALENLNAA